MAGRILIVDAVTSNRIVLRVKLGAAYYCASAAENGAAALSALAGDRFDLVLLDLDLPDMPGLEVLTRIRRDRNLRDLPVIVMTAARDRATRLGAIAAGADDILTKPLAEPLLLARVRSLLRRKSEQGEVPDSTLWGVADPAAPYEHPALVAVVTRRSEQRLRLTRDLAGRIGHTVTPLSREDIFAADPATAPEAFVLDDTPAQALPLVSELRSRPGSSHAGVVMLCDGAAEAAMAFDLGADEVVPSDVDPDELALRLTALIRRTRAADLRRESLRDGLRLAMTDPLTGLFNRRYALTELGRISERARLSGQSFAVMVVDLDRFKSVNDRFGHAAGDLVLTEVAQRLTASLRHGDLVARIGGEEFVLALFGLDLREARVLAETLCATIQSRAVALPDHGQVTVTISIGLAMGRGEDAVDALIDRADRALFTAKSKGRNQVATDRRAA